MRILEQIRTLRQYEAALAEMEKLWGAKSGTAEGNSLDALATLIDTYEAKHFPMDLPDWPAPGLDDTQLSESSFPLELHRAQI
ncbi:MAG: hypothetical protein K2Y71_06455, partial [Xanthobacteraceae bacterium]|nr:hypothetical protein [Xanthobacteraceae bacterium]